MATHRRQARIFALQILYQCEIAEVPYGPVLEKYWDHMDTPQSEQAFATQLVHAVMEGRASWDEQIVSVLEHWQLSRIACIDRNLLRLAIAECACLHTPEKVVINEVLEIAKDFSSERSAEFINGVLDRLLIRHGGMEKKKHENAA